MALAVPQSAWPHSRPTRPNLHFCGTGCGCSRQKVSPQFGSQDDTVTLTYDPNTFREERGDYEYGKIYSPNGELTWGQQVCTSMIQLYQRQTRFNENEFWGDVGKAVSAGCPYPKHDKLSCSEYMLIAIHKLGVIKGIWSGTKRLTRCFAPPLNTWMAKNIDDPVFKIQSPAAGEKIKKQL